MPSAIDTLMEHLTGYHAVPTPQGLSGAQITRYEAPGRTARYLKTGSGPVADEIEAEARRLAWLQGRVPCPTLLGAAREGTEASLVTIALPGVAASALLEAEPALAPQVAAALAPRLAAALRTLHALPVEACPFDARWPIRLEAARRRVAEGLVDDDDFDAERAGWRATDVLQALEAESPLGDDLCVTHGDCTLANVFLSHGRVSGFLDVGRLGVADPYQDLALLHRELGEYGAPAQQALWDAYGIARPDNGRIRRHLLLDELF